MIKYLNNGAIISFVVMICLLIILNYPPLINPAVIVLFSLQIIKISWLIENKLEKLRDYSLFFIIFLYIIIFIICLNPKINDNFFIIIGMIFKKNFNIIYFKEIYFYFLILIFRKSLFHQKNIIISMVVYFYIIVEIFVWFLKYLFNKDFYFLWSNDINFQEFLSNLNNILYLNHTSIFNLYQEYSHIFSCFYYYFIILVLSKNFEKFNFNVFMDLQTSNKNILLGLLGLMSAMTICSYFFCNYPLMDLYLNILMVFLAYIEFIGSTISYFYFYRKMSSTIFLILVSIIRKSLIIYLPYSGTVFNFLFGLFGYLLSVIYKIY